MPLALLLFLPLACVPTPRDSGLAAPLEPLALPCGDAAVTAIAAASGGRGWVACGDGLLATDDAGRSFAVDAPAARVEINRLHIEPDGALLACGADPESAGLLWRQPRAGGWELLLDTADAGDLGACERVARTPGGGLAVSGAAAPGLVLRGRDGAWRRPSRWVEGPEPRIYDLLGTAGGWAALGAGLVGPPSFLVSASASEPLPLAVVLPEPDFVGELWALGTPDGGATWVAGGRDLGDDEGPTAVLLRSDDGGATWGRAPLPVGLGWIRALVFSSDRGCGVAVGQRQVRDEGGFLLVSCDAGASWAEVAAVLPPLRAAAALDEGFLAGGEDGYLGRGWWP
ncbi:MAG: hypothetical protein ABIO70_14855 [Pseudomonadota bacterium]